MLSVTQEFCPGEEEVSGLSQTHSAPETQGSTPGQA